MSKSDNQKPQEEQPLKLQEKYGISFHFPEPFLQKHLVVWQNELGKLSNDSVSNAVYRGGLVKATIRQGWVQGITEEEIPEKHPGIIEWASVQIHFFISNARKPPQE